MSDFKDGSEGSASPGASAAAAPAARPSVAQLLSRVAAGDPAAADALAPLVYAELRALAASYLGRERADHTLQPTALVHEAYLRLLGQDRRWAGRAHFMAVAAVAMRNVLVDHARRRDADKRSAAGRRVTLAGAAVAPSAAARREVEVLELDDLLKRLAELDPRRSRVVELKVFAGMTNEQVADVLGVSRSTVADDWTVAKAWLAAELRPDLAAESGRGDRPREGRA